MLVKKQFSHKDREFNAYFFIWVTTKKKTTTFTPPYTKQEVAELRNKNAFTLPFKTHVFNSVPNTRDVWNRLFLQTYQSMLQQYTVIVYTMIDTQKSI